MARRLQSGRGGTAIFFTARLARAGQTTLVDYFTPLRAAVLAVQEDRPFDVAAWVVLPDHLHMIWILPPGDLDYANRWSAIKSRFARALPLETRLTEVLRGRGIWRRRVLSRRLYDRAAFETHLRYCWRDPICHGLAQCPEAWPYSSVGQQVDFAAEAEAEIPLLMENSRLLHGLQEKDQPFQIQPPPRMRVPSVS